MATSNQSALRLPEPNWLVLIDPFPTHLYPVAKEAVCIERPLHSCQVRGRTIVPTKRQVPSISTRRDDNGSRPPCCTPAHPPTHQAGPGGAPGREAASPTA